MKNINETKSNFLLGRISAIKNEVEKAKINGRIDRGYMAEKIESILTTLKDLK